MAITNYSELQAAIPDRLGRTDISAASPVVAEFISSCEKEINRRLRTRDMETRSTIFPANSEFVPTPADFLQVRNFYIDSTSPRRQLRYLSPEMQTARYPLASTNIPQFYSIVGKQFRFAPVPDANYTASLLYYAKLAPLATNLTNWLLTDADDVYLYGSLAQAAIRAKDIEAYTGYKALFDEALGQVQAAADKGRWSGPGLASVPG